jgi:D-3-phosphoglycerate dehydrogenase
MYKIWCERSIPQEYQSLFNGNATAIDPSAQEQEPFYLLNEAHGVLAGGRVYNAEVMVQAPNLLVITRIGIGYDKVDVPAATEHQIAVCNTPDAPTISTAEFAITLMMSVARNVKRVEKTMREALQAGESGWSSNYVAIELAGKQLGLVGSGRIGGHVARIALGMGMRVVAYDPYITPERAAALGIELAPTLEHLLSTSDVVSLHLPLNPDTYKIMNAERFAQMKSGAIFINAARGGHVDEAALIAALERGQLFGAGLDVTDPEPTYKDNPLLYRDDVVLTPHIASATTAGRQKMWVNAVEQIMYVLRGEQPPHLINPEVWPQVRRRWEAMQ